MLIGESYLFRNLGEAALQVIREHGSERAYGGSDQVFREGDKADNFYVLEEGSVHLVMGCAEDLCFTVDRAGEMFGWSALVEPYRYRATARCTSPTRLLVIPRSAVEEVERDYPRDGIVIFKNLAAIVTERLCEAYQEVLSETDLEGVDSFNDGLRRIG
jgi:CRP-like cAMP-binding protein